MNPKTYQIVIKGAASGTSPDEVAKNLASLFKITEVQAKNFLASGNSIVKKNLPFQDTEKYRFAIENVGWWLVLNQSLIPSLSLIYLYPRKIQQKILRALPPLMNLKI